MPIETVTFPAAEVRKLLKRSRQGIRRLHSREQRNDPAYWAKDMDPIRRGFFMSDIAVYGRALNQEQWDLDQKSVPPGLILRLEAGLFLESNDLDAPGRGFKSFAMGLAHTDPFDVLDGNLKRLLSANVAYSWGLTEEQIKPGLKRNVQEFVLKIANLPDRIEISVVPADEHAAARSAWPDHCRNSVTLKAAPE